MHETIINISLIFAFLLTLEVLTYDKIGMKIRPAGGLVRGAKERTNIPNHKWIALVL